MREEVEQLARHAHQLFTSTICGMIALTPLDDLSWLSRILRSVVFFFDGADTRESWLLLFDEKAITGIALATRDKIVQSMGTLTSKSDREAQDLYERLQQALDQLGSMEQERVHLIVDLLDLVDFLPCVGAKCEEHPERQTLVT